MTDALCVVWARGDMFEVKLTGEVSKPGARELRPVVADDHIWNAVAGAYSFQLQRDMSACCCFHVQYLDVSRVVL